jgi:hypothetical protein
MISHSMAGLEWVIRGEDSTLRGGKVISSLLLAFCLTTERRMNRFPFFLWADPFRIRQECSDRARKGPSGFDM